MKNPKKKKARDYFGLTGCIACVAVCFLILLIMLDNLVTRMNIYNTGNQTVGTIHQIRRGGRRSHHVYIRYRTNDSSIERIQRVNISSNHNRLAPHPLGTNVLIMYHPNDPNNIIYGTARNIINEQIFPICLVGSLMIFGIVETRRQYLIKF